MNISKTDRFMKILIVTFLVTSCSAMNSTPILLPVPTAIQTPTVLVSPVPIATNTAIATSPPRPTQTSTSFTLPSPTTAPLPGTGGLIAWPRDNQFINGLVLDEQYVYFSVGPGPIMRQTLDPSQPLHLEEFAKIRYPKANVDGSQSVLPRVLKDHWLYYIDVGDENSVPNWTLRAKNTQTLAEKTITSGKNSLINFSVDGDVLAWIDTGSSGSGQEEQSLNESVIKTIQLSTGVVKVLDSISHSSGYAWEKIALSGDRLVAVQERFSENAKGPQIFLFSLKTGRSNLMPDGILTPSEKTYPIAVALSGPWLACKVSETGTVLYNLDTHQRQTFEELFSNDSELFLNTERIEGDWLYWSGSAKGNIYNLARNQLVNILPIADRNTHFYEMTVYGTTVAWISIEPSGYVIGWKELPQPPSISNSSGLTIEEDPIVSKPDDLDPVSAPQLLFGTWQEVRDRHASQKQPIYQIPFEIVNGKDVLSAMNGDSQYQAVVTYANGNAAQAILEVKQGEAVVFRKEGLIFVTVEIPQALWVDGPHWTLEIAALTSMQSSVAGQVFRDGKLLNDQYGYQEMFNYRLLDGKPIYFYQKDGKVRLSYNGSDLPLVYDDVPHFACCGGAVLNPQSGPNWLTFWGRRGTKWYYVQIGRYE